METERQTQLLGRALQESIEAGAVDHIEWSEAGGQLTVSLSDPQIFAALVAEIEQKGPRKADSPTRGVCTTAALRTPVPRATVQLTPTAVIRNTDEAMHLEAATTRVLRADLVSGRSLVLVLS